MHGCFWKIPQRTGSPQAPSLPAPVLTVPSAGSQGIPNFCLSYIYKALVLPSRERIWPLLCLVAVHPAAPLLMGGSG